ncbi:unnamed protein product [Allacma fusca]|uniref:Uncharacterized protein n=1 Tax=Allacma fusca TaxID=39272 RepID=A0A8J2P204_9HEXA|nr:unnamed protein product [Allacma fusca]
MFKFKGFQFDSVSWTKLNIRLRKQTRFLVILFLEIAAFVKCVPLELKSYENLRLKLFGNRWKLLWYLVNFIVCFQWSFVTLNFKSSLERSWATSNEPALHLLYFAMYSFSLILFINMYFRNEEFVVIVNHFEDFKVAAADWGLKLKDGYSNPVTILAVHYFVAIAVGIYSVALGLFLFNYESYIYIFSWLPKELKQNNLIFLCFFLYEAYVYLCFGSIFAVYFFICLCTLFPIMSVMATLRTLGWRRFRILKMYILLQLLMCGLNDFLAEIFMPMYCFMVVAAPVSCLYISLTLFGCMDMFLYLLFPSAALFWIALIFILDLLASTITNRGKLLLSELKIYHDDMTNFEGLVEKMQSVYIQKRRVALRDIMLKISFFGHVTIGTINSKMNEMCNYLLLLLSF